MTKYREYKNYTKRTQVPKEVAAYLKLKDGDRLGWYEVGDGVLIKKIGK